MATVSGIIAWLRTWFDDIYALTGHTHTGMLTTSDVKDNLTSTDTDKPLSAKQGKVLNDLIGDAIDYINL